MKIPDFFEVKDISKYATKMCRATFSVNPYCGHISSKVTDFRFCHNKDAGTCLDRKGSVIKAFSIQAQDGQYCRQCLTGSSIPSQSYGQLMLDLKELGKNMTRREWLIQELAMQEYHPNFEGFISEVTGHQSWEDWSRRNGGVHAQYGKESS